MKSTTLTSMGVAVTLALVACSSSPIAPFVPPPPHVIANVTLSGVVSEVTPTGLVPLAGVRVFLSDVQDVETDAQGVFSFTSVWVCPCPSYPSIEAGVTKIGVWKEGFEDAVTYPPSRFGFPSPFRDITINGDTRINITLMRR
jgi:hypothetical protein